MVSISDKIYLTICFHQMICQHGSFQNDPVPGTGIPINTNDHYFTLLFTNAFNRY